MLQRPNKDEYPEYYEPYIQLVHDGDFVQQLKENLQETIKLFEGISEEDGLFRYAANKWSIKEVLGHIADTERIMSYRLLRIGRGDPAPLAGFSENDYVAAAQINQHSIKSILADFTATRNATITLVQTIPQEAWTNKGTANQLEITTRAIAYIIIGHETHHRNIIKERYLKQ